MIFIGRAKQIDLVLLAARDAVARSSITSIDQVFARKEVLVGERLLDARKLPEVRGWGDRRLHLRNEMREVVVTSFGQMHLIPHPMHLPFGRKAHLWFVGRLYPVRRRRHGVRVT